MRYGNLLLIGDLLGGGGGGGGGGSGTSGIGNVVSTSTATTTNENKQTAASEGSLAVGAGGKFLESGSAEVGSNSNVGNTQTTLGSGSTVTITTADADVLTKALDAYQQLSSGFGSSLNQFVSNSQANQADQLQKSLDAINAGKESADTGAQNRKIFVVIAIAFIALIGFLSFRKS